MFAFQMYVLWLLTAGVLDMEQAHQHPLGGERLRRSLRFVLVSCCANLLLGSLPLLSFVVSIAGFAAYILLPVRFYQTAKLCETLPPHTDPPSGPRQ